MKKQYAQMTARELGRATREFDRPSPSGEFRSMTPAERRQWQRIVKGPGRPRKGDDEKAARVLISIRPTLLKAARSLAKTQGKSLSGLIAGQLQAAIGRKRRIA